MNNVVRTSREVRFTVTIALEIHVKFYEIENKLEEEVLEEVGRIDYDAVSYTHLTLPTILLV